MVFELNTYLPPVKANINEIKRRILLEVPDNIILDHSNCYYMFLCFWNLRSFHVNMVQWSFQIVHFNPSQHIFKSVRSWILNNWYPYVQSTKIEPPWVLFRIQELSYLGNCNDLPSSTIQIVWAYPLAIYRLDSLGAFDKTVYHSWLK